MRAPDWISLTAVAVAGLSVLVTGFLAPWLGAQRERERRIAEERSQVYVDAIRLVRERLRDVENRSTRSMPKVDLNVSDAEADIIQARLWLYAPESVQERFSLCIQAYNTTFLPGFDIGNAADNMKVLMDDMVGLMREDIGTRQQPPMFRELQRRR
jgi:hypothetical protein